MRKIILLAAMLAMVMVAAAPAFAQATAVGGNVQIQNQYCPQVVSQYANADQDNTGGGIGAGIAQNLGISQDAVNACLQAGGDINVGDDDEVVTVVEEVPEVVHEEEIAHPAVEEVAPSVHEAVVYETAAPAPEAAPSVTAPSAAPAEAPSEAASATYSVLPDTGGLSILTVGSGILLLGGGLVARRMFR